MFYIGYDPVGKTLEQVLVDLGRRSHGKGAAVFLLESEDDKCGKIVAEEFSLFSILRENVWLRSAVVVSHNDFFGEDIFRVKETKSGSGRLNRKDLCVWRNECEGAETDTCESCEKYEPHSFIDDEEKMRDFAVMAKEDFLASYSYLTEEEYDATKRKAKELGSRQRRR